MVNFENLNKALFPGVGPYDIPPIAPVTDYPTGDFIPVSDAMTEKHPEGKNLHCFVDDYRFNRLWNTPDRYVPQNHLRCGTQVLYVMQRAGRDLR